MAQPRTTLSHIHTRTLRSHTRHGIVCVQGILSLAYCEDFRFLISAGFDHEALVWSPFVPSLL